MIVDLDPTSPLRKIYDIKESVKNLKKKNLITYFL